MALVLVVNRAYLPPSGLVAPLLIAGVLVLFIAVLLLRRPASVRWPVAEGIGLLVIGLGVFDVLRLMRGWEILSPVPMLVFGLVYVPVVVAALVLSTRQRAGWSSFAVLMIIQTAVVGWMLSAYDRYSDVTDFTHQGVRALLTGRNPYAMTIPNHYSPADSLLFYGPGIVVDGRVNAGYPYLPLPLLTDIPGVLLGDERWIHLVSLVALAIVVRIIAGDRLGVICAVAIMLQPLAAPLVVLHWVEPVIGLVVGLLVLAMRSRHRTGGALALTALLVSKQYVAAFLPLLLLVSRRLGVRAVIVAIASAAALLGAFFLWGPVSFVRSAVSFPFSAPVRPDSLSLTAALHAAGHAPPDWSVSAVSLIGGLAVAALVARHGGGAGRFALGAAAAFLVTVLFSKVGHPNYYALASLMLLVGIAAYDAEDAGEHPTEDAKDGTLVGADVHDRARPGCASIHT